MSECCDTLHRLFNAAKRLSYPFNGDELRRNGTYIQNGIYILFEKGERAHFGDRIVRVGTHREPNRLFSRLQQHFMRENKESSIFRKNIGRAILSKTGDRFLTEWEKKKTNNQAKLLKVEQEVSAYIRDNISFVVIPEDDKAARRRMESGLISTISLCDEHQPSSAWLGIFSSKERIRKSGLWLEQHLREDPLSPEDLALIRNKLELLENS